MSTESQIAIKPKYLLDDNNSEITRLKNQYHFFKTVFDYPDIVPPVVNVSRLGKVIDVATGTGAWALDFASRPDVRNRGVKVFACDISTAKFPRVDKADVNKITFFQHDVTKPFPAEMLGTFDLVNMTYLGFALTAPGWRLALKNLRSLLTPGGYLVLRDGDPLMFTHENPPPLEGHKPDLMAYTQGNSTLATINRIYSGWALRQGFVVGLSYHFRDMLRDASFQLLSSTRALAPTGQYCDFYRGLNETPLSEFTAFSLQSFSQVFDVLTSAMMDAGCLELGDGTRIADEVERLALMKELRHFAEGGLLFLMSEWVVRRPLAARL